MDNRHKRKEKSRKALVEALERLQRGDGTHTRHRGIRVRITKQAVAREARVSSATLYRFPDVVKQIGVAAGVISPAKPRSSEQLRAKLVDEVADLRRREQLLLAENVRLTRLLVKYDPTLGKKIPLDFEREKQRRRT